MDRHMRFASPAPGIRHPPHRRCQLVEWFLLMVVLAGTVGGCSVWRTVPLAASGGGPPAQMRIEGSIKQTGGVKITLPGNRVLEGQWQRANAATDLDSLTLKTPSGEVSAADLVGDERPSLVVNIWGDGLRLICVCTGDDQSGHIGTCVDSEGTRWTSTQRFLLSPQ